jgi:DNA topoisomerase-1
MSKDYCFTIRTKVIIDENLKDQIKSHIQKLFRNKKLFGNLAFGKDEKLPFEVYFGLAWKVRKAVCIIPTSRAKENKERLEGILDKIKNEDLKIKDTDISLNKPEIIEECDFERVKKKKGEKIWDKLEHNGPYFKHIYEPYEQHKAPLIYDGKEYKLNAKEEEAATYYARRIITEEKSVKKFLDKDQFNKNYFNDFKTYLTDEHRKIFKDFKKLDFSKMVKKLKSMKEEKDELKKSKSPDDKLAEKIQKLEKKANYSYAYVNDLKKEIRNPSVEIPGLYIGQGNILTNKGKIKKVTEPEDVIINASKGDVPNPPPGHKWGGIVEDKTASWIAKYKDSITGKDKYILLSESGDLFKFEKARKLNKYINEVEKRMDKLLESSSKRDRQIGTIVYLIKNYGLRAGSADTEDGGEDKTEKVVGASTLMVQNVIPDEEEESGEHKVELSFVGKDSVYFNNTIDVSDIVYENIKEFMKGKKPSEKLFDLVDANEVNKYLKSIDRDFTAKVFRTRLASSIMYEGLKQFTKYKKNATDEEKVADFNSVNRDVALRLNHKKGITDAQKQSVEKEKEKIKELKQKLKEEENENKKQKLKEQIKDKKFKLDEKIRNLGIALDTSKKNYIDPRIIISWADSVNLPIEKIYKTEGLRKHFAWALESEDYNADWDYVQIPLDCIVGEKLIPSVERAEPKKAKVEPKVKPSKVEVEPKVKPSKVEVEPKVKPSKVEVEPKEKIEIKPYIERYTDKSFAVFGETKSIKDQLKELGGRFNKNLNGKVGWIFPNIKKGIVEKFLENYKVEDEIEVEIYPEIKPIRKPKPVKKDDDDEIPLYLLEKRKKIEEENINLINQFCKEPNGKNWNKIPETYKEFFIKLANISLKGNKGNLELSQKIIELK